MRERKVLSMLVIEGEIKLPKLSGKETSSLVKSSLKLLRNNFLSSLVSKIHSPSMFLMALMLFLLLCTMVDRWKNLEFLPPYNSHNSRDFFFHNISLG